MSAFWSSALYSLSRTSSTVQGSFMSTRVVHIKLGFSAVHRLRILAELHWKLPRPLTAAEQQLRDMTLPGLEASVAKLQSTVQVSTTS